MDIQTIIAQTFGAVIRPYGVPVIVVCIGTFLAIKIGNFIVKKINDYRENQLACKSLHTLVLTDDKRYKLHPWFKVLATFVIATIYIFVTNKFQENEIQIFLGKIFALGASASSAYEVVIKYLISWIQSFIVKDNTPTAPSTSGNTPIK